MSPAACGRPLVSPPVPDRTVPDCPFPGRAVSGPTVLTRRAALLGLAGTVTAACTTERRAGPAVPADSGDIVIGASLELSGPAAAVGVLQERALRIAAEQINAGGVAVGGTRRTVRLVVRDNTGRADTAAAVARRLTGEDRAHALIGGTLAETALATIPVAQDRAVPLIALADADTILAPVDRRGFVFKVTPDPAGVARRLARVIRRHKLRRVVVLGLAGEYGESGLRSMQEAVDEAGLELVRAIRLPTRPDELPATARRVTAVAPDAVVVWSTAPTSGRTAAALRDAGYAGRFYLDPGAVAEVTLAKETAAAVEGAYVVHPATLDPSSLASNTAGLDRRAFVYRYVQLHGSFTGFAPYAADALALVTAAVRQADRLDPAEITARLENITMQGIAGSYAFTPTAHGGMDEQSLAVFAVERGRWVPA